MTKKLKNLFKKFKIDGYIVPKNDEYFNEYINPSNDRLKFISNFSGSAGFAIILKNRNYLFVDGRYTEQAKKESGKNFSIVNIPKELPKNILKNKKKIKIGFDPKLHTEKQVNMLFKIKNLNLVAISENLIDLIWYNKPKERFLKSTDIVFARSIFKNLLVSSTRKHSSTFNGIIKGRMRIPNRFPHEIVSHICWIDDLES